MKIKANFKRNNMKALKNTFKFLFAVASVIIIGYLLFYFLILKFSNIGAIGFIGKPTLPKLKITRC